MPTAVVVPDLGTDEDVVTISSWLVTTGEHVEIGDRLVELLIRGVTFDIPSPQAGELAKIDVPVSKAVRPGDVIGWIAADDRA